MEVGRQNRKTQQYVFKSYRLLLITQTHHFHTIWIPLHVLSDRSFFVSHLSICHEHCFHVIKYFSTTWLLMTLRNSIKCVVGRKINCYFESHWQFVLVSLGCGSKIHFRENFFLIDIKETFQWAFDDAKLRTNSFSGAKVWNKEEISGSKKNASLVVLIVIDFWLSLGVWGQGDRLRTQKGEKNMDISNSGLLRGGVGERVVW